MSVKKSRRTFLQSSALGVVGAGISYWTGLPLSAAVDSKSPNERPVVAFVGTGIRFHTALGRQSTDYGPCAAICDVDAVQAGRAMQVVVDQHHKHGYPIVVATHEDYRHVLDRQDVDAVVIATPDHWHTKIAIEAMQAGKDVYCEKPLTLTIREGQQILQAIESTGRVLQVGSQQRTEFDKMFATAVALVRNGRVGQMKRVTCAIGDAPEVGHALQVTNPPKHLNWDLWQGQAPATDYLQGEIFHTEGWGAGHPLGRTHRYFRWWYEYSGGIVTDWGAHHIDIATWALDQQRADIGPVTIDPLEGESRVPFKDGMPTLNDRFNTFNKFKVRMTFANGVEMDIRHDASDDLGMENGIMFQGSKGRFLVNRGKLVGKPVEALVDNPLPEDALANLYGGKVPTGHMANFMECIKTRKQPVSDALSHHRAISFCHAANIALRLGRKLVFDPAIEEFVGDSQANSFLEREQRKGFEIHV